VPFARIIGIDLLAPERLDCLEAILFGSSFRRSRFHIRRIRPANRAHGQYFIDRAHSFFPELK
jgi:hypothetical protein